MKPFNLQEALAGKSICYRDGSPAKRPDMGIPQDVDDAIEYHKRKIGDKDHRALIAQMIQDTEAMRKLHEEKMRSYQDLVDQQAREIERLKLDVEGIDWVAQNHWKYYLEEKIRSARWKAKAKQLYDDACLDRAEIGRLKKRSARWKAIAKWQYKYWRSERGYGL